MKKNIINWLKENHNSTYQYAINDKIYCGQGNWLYEIDITYNEDNEVNEDTLYIFISKNRNSIINRIRGFDNNKSANNGVGLHYYNIEYYVLNIPMGYKRLG